MDSLKALGIRSTPHNDRPASHPAMNRHLAYVIDLAGFQSRCDAVLLARVEGAMPAPVAHTHDFGRDGNDTTPSGEGLG